MFIKISNLGDGVLDYKGLDISQFKAGSHIYDFDNKTLVVEYLGEFENHQDIEILNDSDFAAIKQEEENKPQPKSEVEILREENTELKSRLELVEAAVDDMIFNGGAF